MSVFFNYFLFFFQGKIWGFSSQQSGNTKLDPPLPLKCETAQYHKTTCTVKSHSRALATFQNIGKTRKQGEAI